MMVPHTCVLGRSVMSDSVRPHGPQPARLLYPWASPGKNTGVGCRALLQGTFPTEGWERSLAPPALAGKLFPTRATRKPQGRGPLAYRNTLGKTQRSRTQPCLEVS